MRKKKVEIRTQWISLDDRINKLRENLERLEKFKHYEEYFKHVGKKTKCCYFTELRKVIYGELLASGLNVVECASVLHISHSTLVHLDNKLNNFKYVEDEVKQFGKIWIEYQRYPFTGAGMSRKLFNPKEQVWGTKTPYNLCSIYKNHRTEFMKKK